MNDVVNFGNMSIQYDTFHFHLMQYYSFDFDDDYPENKIGAADLYINQSPLKCFLAFYLVIVKSVISVLWLFSIIVRIKEDETSLKR